MQLNSNFFQVVADLLRYLEGLNAPTAQYGILDGGSTLELFTALYEQIKESSEFKIFEGNNGSWYCFDDTSWTVQSDGCKHGLRTPE
jgi:hypothetical protein